MASWKASLDCSQGLLARLLFFGTLLLFDQSFNVGTPNGPSGWQQGGIALILNDSAAGAGGEIQEWRINQALNVTRWPGDMIRRSGRRRQIVNHSGAGRAFSATRGSHRASARYNSAYASP